MTPEFRRFLHVLAARVLHGSGALSAWRWLGRMLRKDQVCVVGLHRVLTRAEHQQSDSLDGMIIHDDTYLALLAYLQQRFQVVSLDAFLAIMRNGSVATKPLCLITFDDGWGDTHSRALPGLKKFGLPAIVFLATGSIGGRGGFWVERVKRAWRTPLFRQQVQSAWRESGEKGVETLAATDMEGIVEWLKRMPAKRRDAILDRMVPPEGSEDTSSDVDTMLTWEQVRELSEAGVDLGAHTVTHPLLSYEDEGSIERELSVSKEDIEKRLGKTVRAFAYPNGDWNEVVREKTAKGGFECAFTTNPAWYCRRENPYSVSRILLHEGNITAQDGKFSPAMLDLTLAGWV
jgi:peptidoglycan/xylan/chitin deacetylase (PgdA/CDA1 family)